MTWPSEQLEVLCSKIGSGATPRGGNSNYKTSGIALVRSMNVHLGRFKPDDLAFIDDDQAAKLSNVTLEPDDVLLNITGASVARCCTLDKTVLPARVNQHVCILRPEPDKLHYQYLMRYLTSDQTQRKLLRMAGAGATREAITKADIEKFQIPLPPLAEQKRIAAILDAADALRARRRESLAQLDALLQSTFLEMFGDPVTNPMEWETAQIGDVGQVITGNTPSRAHAEYYGDSIEWIKSDNINDPSFFLTPAEEKLSIIGRAVARTVPSGSILVTCIAGSPSCIGNVAIADREVAFNQQINGFVPSEKMHVWYAFGVILLGKRLVQRASTNSMKGMVSKSAFSGIVVPVPPLDLQRRFAAIVESVEEQKARMRAHLAELDALFASLQASAFGGEL